MKVGKGSLLPSGFPKILPGATIALVAPAGVFDQETLEAAKNRILSVGYNILHSEKIWLRRGDVCGDEWERASDIIQFMNSLSVDAIWCIRGGYGSSQILSRLPRLPWHKKPIIGYSDISFLHFFIHSHLRALTFHCPNFIELANMDSEHLNRIFQILQDPQSFLWTFQSSQVLRPGVISGRLIGGNLTCLIHLLGTSHFSKKAFRGAILFVEDINERPYRIDRMFNHLRDAGILHEIGALILGHFVNCGSDYGEIRNRILRICSPFNFPIVEGFPVGHTNSQLCIPMGLQALIDTSEGILLLRTDSHD
ncbi:MAG: LD-carboxypeptidase [Syntrophobacterales bacterium]|nr:LD-carboxypeptidase [Syntrophobacterales bacterium]